LFFEYDFGDIEHALVEKILPLDEGKRLSASGNGPSVKTVVVAGDMPLPDTFHDPEHPDNERCWNG
jgi:hypothetical protein